MQIAADHVVTFHYELSLADGTAVERSRDRGEPIAALIVGYALSVPYNILATVGVWRAAAHYAGPQHWAQAARLATLVGMAVLSVT